MRLITIVIIVLNVFYLHAQDFTPCRGEDGFVGYCDKYGQVVVEQQFYDALPFSDGHAAVMTSEAWGIIDGFGEWLMKPKYDHLYHCKHVPDRFLVNEADEWFFIDPYGVEMSDRYQLPDPEHTFEIEGRMATFAKGRWFAVTKKNKWGVVDVFDEVKIPLSQDFIQLIHGENEGPPVAMVMEAKGEFAWQRIDLSKATGFVFNNYLGYSGKYLFFQINEGDPVIMNAFTGEYVDNPDFEFIGLRNASGKMGLVSRQGTALLPFEYSDLDTESVPGFAVFGNDLRKGLMNKNGRTLLEPVYADIILICNQPKSIYARNKDSKKVAVFVENEAHQFQQISPFDFTYATCEDGRIKIIQGQRYAYLALDGTLTWIE